MNDDEAERHQGAVDEAVASGQLVPFTVVSDEADDPLDAEQRARATAVWEARYTLEKRGQGFGQTSTPPSLADVIRLATFILEGSHE